MSEENGKIDVKALIDEEKRIIIKEEEKAEDNLSLVDRGVDAAIIHKITNDDEVKSRMLSTASDIINNKLDEKQHDSERDKKRAALENNKDACDLYGIDEKTVPIWVVKAAKIVQDFWYIVWIIIGFVTTAPVVFLSKKISVVFKRTWVAVLLAVIIYLAVVLVPLIINIVK